MRSASSNQRTGYRPYTTKFDREVSADDLGSVLGELSSTQKRSLDDAWNTLQTDLLGWKTHLHVLAAEASARIRGALPDEERAETAVTLLIDQSGSMRGQKMVFAAAAVDVAQEFLVTLGCSCEILGSRRRNGLAVDRGIVGAGDFDRAIPVA